MRRRRAKGGFLGDLRRPVGALGLRSPADAVGQSSKPSASARAA